MPRPTVSVALCTCNGERYIREQLESIAGQTRVPDEVVICDDCSTDETAAIVAEASRTAPYALKWTVNKSRLGTIKNFERAIGLCGGDLIFLADQDDWWEAEKIETIEVTLQRNPAAGYAFSNAAIVDTMLADLGENLWEQIGFVGHRLGRFRSGDQVRVLTAGGNVVYGNTMAFRRSCVERVNPIDSRTAYVTHDTWIALVLSATGSPGIPVDRPLIRYRQHGQQQAGVGREVTFSDVARRALQPRGEILRERSNGFAAIAERVAHVAPGSNELRELQGVVEHLRARAEACASGGVRRAKLVWSELVSGRYGRYSSSWKSGLRDLLER